LVSLVVFLSSLPLIPLVFLPRGKRFERALAAARAQGTVTPELTAAFHDRVVYLAHVYELATVFVVLVLMVTRPF
jgi:hypothetical protein